MSTGISNVSLPNGNQNVSCLRGIRNWGQNNPTTVKILGVAGAILGIALLISSSLALPVGIVIAASLPIVGAISLIASLILLGSSSLPLPGNISFGFLYTTFQDVETRPAYYLELLTRSASAFPERILLTNNRRAVDVGGVTQEFIAKLMK